MRASAPPLKQRGSETARAAVGRVPYRPKAARGHTPCSPAGVSCPASAPRSGARRVGPRAVARQSPSRASACPRRRGRRWRAPHEAERGCCASLPGGVSRPEGRSGAGRGRPRGRRRKNVGIGPEADSAGAEARVAAGPARRRIRRDRSRASRWKPCGYSVDCVIASKSRRRTGVCLAARPKGSAVLVRPATSTLRKFSTDRSCPQPRTGPRFDRRDRPSSQPVPAQPTPDDDLGRPPHTDGP